MGHGRQPYFHLSPPTIKQTPNTKQPQTPSSPEHRQEQAQMTRICANTFAYLLDTNVSTQKENTTGRPRLFPFCWLGVSARPPHSRRARPRRRPGTKTPTSSTTLPRRPIDCSTFIFFWTDCILLCVNLSRSVHFFIILLKVVAARPPSRIPTHTSSDRLHLQAQQPPNLPETNDVQDMLQKIPALRGHLASSSVHPVLGLGAF